MKRIIPFMLLVLCSAEVAIAETYTWTDDQGVVTFTDNPARLPSSYSSRVQRGENVLIRIPKVQKTIRKQYKKKLQATVPRNRIKSTVARAKPTDSPQGTLQPPKGQLDGDRVNPAPPSMKQPISEPRGDQPTPKL